MNLSELQTFLAIVETGSLVRASQRLNVTQSTVTARLKSLEATLGQTLVNRHRSGVTLTTAGERLRRYADTINDLWRQARQETALSGGLSAVCNIGCHPDLWPGRVETFFDTVRHRQPDVALSVWHGTPRDLDHWITAGLTDVSIGYWPTAAPGCTITELAEETLRLISTRAGAPMRLGPDYVLADHGQTFARDHAAAFANAGAARVAFGSGVQALDHIRRHGGSAYLSDDMTAALRKTGQLHDVAGAPVFARPVYLLTRRRQRDQWDWFASAAKALGLRQGTEAAH